MDKTDGMIDVSGKDVTVRIAKSEGSIKLGDEAFGVVRNGIFAKGDVLAPAKIAAIQAVKSTPSMIPLCHSILIESVKVEFAVIEEDK